MSHLPPYNSDAECPKCGHDKVSTKHERAGAPFAEFAVATGARITLAEHMRRTCHRCQHAWAEAPLDREAGS